MNQWISTDQLISYLDEYGQFSYEHIVFEVVDSAGCVEYVDITPDHHNVFNRNDIGLVYVI